MPSTQESASIASQVTTGMYHWETTPSSVNKLIGGQTPFLTQDSWYTNGQQHWQLPQIVSVSTGVGSNSIDYYHMIVGDSSTGFVQETWIPLGWNMDFSHVMGSPANSPMTYKWAVSQYNNAGNYTTGTCGTGCDSMHSASGGDSTVINSGSGSPLVTYSAGTGKETIKAGYSVGNAEYPLDAPAGKDSGNGSGNPTKVVIRQEITDGQGTFSNVFLKSAFSQKPVITLDVSDADMQSHVKIDMSNSDYNTSTTAGTMTNTFVSPTGAIPLLTSSVGGTPHSWDMAVDSEAGKTNITAGQYTYTPGAIGTGYTQWGGANGAYSYASGNGFETTNVTWSDFMNPQVGGVSPNPWSFDVNKPAGK